jgi:hypothetical protein
MSRDAADKVSAPRSRLVYNTVVLILSCKSSRNHFLAVVPLNSWLSRARKQAVPYPDFFKLVLDAAIPTSSSQKSFVGSLCSRVKDYEDDGVDGSLVL